MKNPKMLALLLMITALPLALSAAPDVDEKIKDAAKASYNYRTLLNDDVKVKSSDGIVTLTGTVPDADLKTLAEDTVRDLPGVVRVDNRIEVEPAPPAHSDQWIALKARGSLLVRANVSVTDTDVLVKDGIVTLTGKADNLAQKELTAAYVRDIEGVREVRNEIVVIAPPVEPQRTMGEVMDDTSITAQVKYALLTHRSTSALKTNITTKDGVVHIEGEAASDAEQALVTHLAKGVRGVKSVNNNMTVKR